jgi:Bifunctional DNA primase/polymerase, N-terminal
MQEFDRWDPERNLLHRAVLQYLKNRWPVIPIWWMEGERCACGKPHCNSPGKHPIAKLVPHGIKDATLDLPTAIKWWTQYPKANIAIALGIRLHG